MRVSDEDAAGTYVVPMCFLSSAVPIFSIFQYWARPGMRILDVGKKRFCATLDLGSRGPNIGGFPKEGGTLLGSLL